MSKIIIVAGMHRSGTSLAALFLNELGVNMGDSILPLSSANPTGHYEDLDFLKIHTKILNSCKGDWDSPPKRFILNRVWENHAETIKKKISRESRNKPIWGWKDPRTSLFLEKYLHMINNPLVVYCKRDSCEVEKSLFDRNKISRKYTRILKIYYDRQIEEALGSCGDVKVVDINFKDMITSPDKTMTVLEKFTGIELNDKDRIKGLIIQKKEINSIKVTLKRNEKNVLLFKAIANPLKALKVLNKRVQRKNWRKAWYKNNV